MKAHDPADGWKPLTNDPTWPDANSHHVKLTDEQIIENTIRQYVQEYASFYEGAMESHVVLLAAHIANALRNRDNHATE